MGDVFDADKRREVMSLIRHKNTEAEIVVFQFLRKNGIYHQRHYRRATGCPDVALPRKKKAVFIDGDFWHGRELKRVIDRGGSKYWIDKLTRNIERDTQVNRSLAQGGWEVLRVWESDLLRKKTRQEELARIANFLKSDTQGMGSNLAGDE